MCTNIRNTNSLKYIHDLFTLYELFHWCVNCVHWRCRKYIGVNDSPMYFSSEQNIIFMPRTKFVYIAYKNYMSIHPCMNFIHTGCIFHGDLPVRGTDHPADPGRHFAGLRRRCSLLHHTWLEQITHSQGMTSSINDRVVSSYVWGSSQRKSIEF